MDWRGVGSNPAGDICFHFEFFAPSLFRTDQLSRCKWNQACPFTWGHSCFRLQIWFIIQGLVYKYLQYSFKERFNFYLVNKCVTIRNFNYLKIFRKYQTRPPNKPHFQNIVMQFQPYIEIGSKLTFYKLHLLRALPAIFKKVLHWITFPTQVHFLRTVLRRALSGLPYQLDDTCHCNWPSYVGP